jgi:acyl-lipid omega-6 desaturase (Delta-12 desaturase)
METVVEDKEVRTGSALVRATFPWSKVEDTSRSWRLLLEAYVVVFAATLTAAFSPWLAVRCVASVVAGLVWVRLFIFFHDYMHGAILRKSRWSAWAMYPVGFVTLNPPSVWKETHNYHHQNNAKMLGAAIGSYPVVTTRIWRHMKSSQKRWYVFARHPLTMLFAYFTVFIGGMCLSAFLRQPRVHWQGPVAIASHFAGLGALTWFFGWDTAFFALFVPVYLSNVFGAYLFYAQHNFPDVKLRDRREWDYNFAALQSSSMMRMGPVMHWFTGNIGYHHVHHLNHKIPFYLLPTVMDEVPELQNPGLTSLWPSDIYAALRLKLWDSSKKRMVSWSEAGLS